MTWSAAFDEPIVLANGSKLVTLLDAGEYISALPTKEYQAPEWQAAMEALILVAEGGGPTMFARIGVMRALNRHYVPESNPRGERTTLGPAQAEEGSMIKAAPEAGVTNVPHAAHHEAQHGASCIAAVVPAMIRYICRNGNKDARKSNLAHIQTALGALQNELRDQIAAQKCRPTRNVDVRGG